MAANAAWVERVKRAFVLHFTKLNGLSLSVDATNFLVETFREVPDDARLIDESLKYIIESYQQQDGAARLRIAGNLTDAGPVPSVLVDLAVLKRVVATLSRNDRDSGDPLAEARRYFEVIDAFTVARYKYDTERKNFFAPREAPTLFAAPTMKAESVRARYELIRQRLQRTTAGALAQKNGSGIIPIQSLVGTAGMCVVFGLLSQLKEERYYLEEPDANIELDLTHLKTEDMFSGLFTEHCFVLAEGLYRDGVFRVLNMAMPPAEPADTSRAVFGHINFWGGRLLETEANLRDIEADAKDAMVVVLSDVWLDQPKVMLGLRTLFQGFAADAPLAFVLMGSFTSSPFVYNGVDSTRYRECFDALADLIAEFPSIARVSHFVFVPSLTDPGMSTVLPRPGLPGTFTERLRSKVARAVFATNPCRKRFCTKELLFFRDDMVTKMRRNCIRPPATSDNIKDLLVRTLFDQSHLCPLPQTVRPIYWAYDHALLLYPLPHVLFLGDQFEQFTVNYANATCCNPGPFATSDLSFFVYMPARNTVEPSTVAVATDDGA